MPYADPIIRKQKAREGHLRRMADPEYAEKIRAYGRMRAKRDRDRIKTYHAKYYLENRERLLTRNRQWESDNPQSRRTRSLKWRHENIEKARSLARKWHADNREYRRQWDHEKRARKLSVTVNPKGIVRMMRKVKSHPTAVCYYCKKTVSTDAIHFDHIVPLSKGGPHSIENLCVSCSHCNQTKLNKMPNQFAYQGQPFLPL